MIHPGEQWPDYMVAVFDRRAKLDIEASKCRIWERPSIGRTQPIQSPPKADPWLDYSDDYSVWKQGQ